jgi:hypothetical protein
MTTTKNEKYPDAFPTVEATKPGNYWWLPACYDIDRDQCTANWVMSSWHPADPHRPRNGWLIGPIPRPEPATLDECSDSSSKTKFKLRQCCETCLYSRWELTAQGGIVSTLLGRCIYVAEWPAKIPPCQRISQTYKVGIRPYQGSNCECYKSNTGSLMS